MIYNCDVTGTSSRLKSQTTRLCVRQLVQVTTKDNIKVPPFYFGEYTGLFSSQQRQCGNLFQKLRLKAISRNFKMVQNKQTKKRNTKLQRSLLLSYMHQFNTLRPRQNVRYFAENTFKRIFLNENVVISIKISLKFIPKGPISYILTLLQIMVWRRPGDKPLSEPMIIILLTHMRHSASMS